MSSQDNKDKEYLRTTVEVLLVVVIFLIGTWLYGG